MTEQPSAPTTDIDPSAQEPKLDYKPQTLDAKTDATSEGLQGTTTAVTLPKPTEPIGNTKDESAPTEQRSTENTEKQESHENETSGNDSANASGSSKQGVSKEALEGPQGPPPHPASEFEDEAKGKKPVSKEPKPGKSYQLRTPLFIRLGANIELSSRARVSKELCQE